MYLGSFNTDREAALAHDFTGVNYWGVAGRQQPASRGLNLCRTYGLSCSVTCDVRAAIISPFSKPCSCKPAEALHLADC